MDRERKTLAAGEPIVFDAVLTPHRSLPLRDFVLLMAVLCAVSFTAGLVFFLVGAWPVAGFLSLDAPLIYLAFRVNYRRAMMYETLHLTRRALTVSRVDHWGEERRWSFQPAWLQVLTDEPARRDKGLTLRSHGTSLVIGSFLAPAEREDLARALRAALTQARGAVATGA